MELKKKPLLLWLLLFFPALLAAQSEQMQREIRISEGILSELFNENRQNDPPLIVLPGSRITGDYIPGYGLHFVIGDRHFGRNIHISGRMEVVQKNEGDRRIIEFRDSDNQNAAPIITRDEIEMKMIEYLTLYAPLIQSIPDGEYIRISTGIRNQISQIFISISDEERADEFPEMTKWVSVSDLRQFRSGRITEEQFLNRIQSADLSDAREIRDYNIFNSILESAVKGADFEFLRVRTSGSFSYLPGLGVQFNLNASSPDSQILSFFSDLAQNPDMNMNIRTAGTDDPFTVSSDELASIRMEIDSSREVIDSIRVHAEQSVDSLKVALKDLSVSISDLFTGERERPDPEDLEREKNLLYEEIKRTIKEYGTTLSSLPDDEMLIISIHWADRDAILPQRTYLRIRKSDLMSSSEPVIQEVSGR